MTIAIKEGSKSRQFGNTDYLRTKLVGGGTCDWVREDARRLTKKKVKKDGTYKASDEHDKYGNSYFAFSSFTVAVKKKSITGKKKDPEHPDDPSYDYEVEVTEDENGNLVEKGVPHHIKIITKPSKLNYRDGENISIAGIVVKAYEKDGSIWSDENHPNGIIPLSELKFEPKKAKHVDKATATSDLVSRSINMASHLEMREEESSDYVWIDVYNTIGACGKDNYGDMMWIAASKTQGEFTELWNRWYNGHTEWTEQHAYEHEYTYEGKTVYFSNRSLYMSQSMTSNAYNGNLYEIGSIQGIAWTMIYGNVEWEGQEITVKWNRPQDEKTLTDKYKVSVSEPLH